MTEGDDDVLDEQPVTIPTYEPEPEPEEPAQDEDRTEDADEQANLDAAETETDQPGDSDGDDEVDAEEEKSKRKRPGKAQRQIQRLEDEVRRLSQRLEQPQQRGNGEPDRAQQAQPAAPPKRGDFATEEEYIDARVEYGTQQALRKVGETHRKQTAEAEKSQTVKTFKEKVEAARDKFDDFDDVVGDLSLPITEAMTDAILESDIGPEISYHLGTNPEECTRISELSPASQGREIGKLEAKLSEPPKPKTEPKPKATNAPEPIKPAAGAGGGGGARKDPGKMSMPEYAKWREAGNG